VPRRSRRSIVPRRISSATSATTVGELVRTTDSGATSLGPIETWSISLRTLVSAVLQSRFPMMLWWSRDLVVIYNDAYQPMLGDKHPRAMGASARDVWAEIWDVLGPQAEGVLDGGPATWNEHLLLFLERKGFVEETYWTFSYSPARDDSGAVGGVLVTVQETTEQVQGERQLEMLRELGARAASGQTVEDACRTAATILGRYDKDIPFGLLYLLHADGSPAGLCAQVGWQQGTAPPELSAWPIDELAASGRPLVVTELGERWGTLLGGPWKRRLTQAVLLALVGGNQVQPSGYLVLGVSPVRALDDAYTRMFRLVGDQIVTSISAARTFEEERRRAEALAEIDRAKTAFFSNVSHEFRTPLTLILGPTEDLLNGAHGQLEARQLEQLELMHRNELRLQKLVNALLDFSRIEAGRVEACFEATDLAALTRDLAGSFHSAVDRAGLELRLDCPALDEPVFVDRDMWEKIVINLLSNALKFTFEGEIAVSLSATSDLAVLRVADTGIGIAEAEMPRLFERFHRIQGARARTYWPCARERAREDTGR
jgi:signal transduction histidine kinase